MQLSTYIDIYADTNTFAHIYVYMCVYTTCIHIYVYTYMYAEPCACLSNACYITGVSCIVHCKRPSKAIARAGTVSLVTWEKGTPDSADWISRKKLSSTSAYSTYMICDMTNR